MTEGNNILQPIFRFQTQNSVVCFLICAANAISYTMELRYQTSPQEAFQQYSINIDRYMRNKLSNDGIYECVFAKCGGGYPVNILEDLLTHGNLHNAGKQLTVKVDAFCFEREAINPITVFQYFTAAHKRSYISGLCTQPTDAKSVVDCTSYKSTQLIVRVKSFSKI